MNQIFFYLLQVIAASGLLYGYYHFALRNKKFHRYNRFYLLMSVVISSFIPFLNIPVYFSEKETESSVMLQTWQVISSASLSSESTTISTTIQNDSTISKWLTAENMVYLVYLFILSFFLLRILISLSKIRMIIKSNPAEQLDKIKFINTNEPGTPFSFFRWLFWNRKIELHSEKGEQIFRHELFHIQQKHSWDIIFIELVSTIFWINPFFYLIKKELKAIHEFLADEFAVKENKNWQYAELLLMQALNTNNHLVNPFFHNQIKRRIAMITTSQNPSYQYLRKLMVLPVAAVIIFLFAFNYQNKQIDPHEFEKAINSITVVIDAGHGGTDAGAKTKDGKYTEAELSLAIAKKIETLGPAYNINVILTRNDEKFPGGATNKNNALKERVELVNKINPFAFVAIHMNTTSDYKQVSKSGFDAYVTRQGDNYPDIQLASSVLGELKKIYTTSQDIRQRGNATIYVIDEAKAPSLLLECGFINNPKDISFVTNEKNQEKIARAILKGLVVFANNSTSKKEWDDQYINGSALDTIKLESIAANHFAKALVVIDGVIQAERGLLGIDSNLILKNQIEEYRVFTDKNAIDKYGENGKYGVIEIDTKENYGKIADTIPKVDTIYWLKEIPAPKRMSPTSAELKTWEDAKIYGVWIDANRISNSDLKNRKPSEFGWYNVSKLAKNAVNYGKHYYQVSLYTQKYYDEKMAVKKDRSVILVKDVVLSDTTKPGQPLIVINGNALPGLKMSALDKMLAPSDIESMSMLNDDTAIKKYGETGKNGAIEIKAKKLTPITQKNEAIKEIRVDGKVVYDDDNKVFEKMEIEPSFPGGEKAWRQFLSEKLNAVIPVDSGANGGTYVVKLQFIVDKEGNISDLKALSKNGFGMEQECLRVMGLSPKWNPGIQNGHKVKAYKRQNITFVIDEEVPEPLKEEVKGIEVAGKKIAATTSDTKTPTKAGSLEKVTVTGHPIMSADKEGEPLAAVYPNPADNNATIIFNSSVIENGEIRVYDVTSSLKMVSKINFVKGENKVLLNVASLSAGTYIINVVGTGNRIAKVVKLTKK